MKKDRPTLFESLCRLAYRHLGKTVEQEKTSKQDKLLEDTLDLLEIKVKPKEVHALSLGAAIVLFILILAMVLVSMVSSTLFTPLYVFFLILPLAVYLYVEKYPQILLESKKTEMLGHIPAIASYLVISLRISPIIEKAVEFASEHTPGFPKKLLKRMVFDIDMGRSSSIVESLSKFADEWGNIPEFKAFMQLLIASTLESSEKNRWMMLDNGMNVLLSGLRERTDTASRKLETPILVVFTFLVILPLIFIGLVPVMPTIGIEVSPLVIFFLYDVVLPILLYIAVSFIISSKPITFPPIEIPAEEYNRFFGIKAGNRPVRYAFYGVIALIAASICLLGFLDLGSSLRDEAPNYPLGTSLILIGITVGLGIYLVGSSYSVKKMRDEIKDIEEEFSETLRQLSVLLSSGRPLPNAMAHISDLNRGRTANIFSMAANNIRLFNIDMREAFFGKRGGSASKIYSEMIHSSLDTIVSMSGRNSKSIASVIIRLSEHIRNMRTVDAEMKKIIGNVTASMVIIAVFVGPLVGGVATSLGYLLSKTLSESDVSGLGFGGLVVKTLNPEVIKLVIGIYVLETTAILAMFSDDLIYGRDAVIKKYHLGIYLPVAAIIFSLTVVVMQLVFEGMM